MPFKKPNMYNSVYNKEYEVESFSKIKFLILQGMYCCWFYRPEETFHLASRKFLEKVHILICQTKAVTP